MVVVCNTGMGDAVESLPAFELIRERWPGVHLAAGYFRQSQRLTFSLSPHISEHVRLRGNARYGWRALRALPFNVAQMRGFDTVLFLYKTELVVWPLVLAARMAGARPLFKHGYRYRDRRRSTYSDFPEHVFFQIVASNLLLEMPLSRVIPPRVHLAEQHRSFADQFFSRHGLGDKPVVLVNNTAIPPDWGIDNYAALANALAERGAHVVILGGSDHQVAEFERVSDRLQPGVVLLRDTTPGELAAVASKCDLFVGYPNGPASIAMAVGLPTLTLFGPGEHGYAGQQRIGPPWWPRGADHEVITKIDWCQASMGAGCTCRREGQQYLEWRGRLERGLKYTGAWEAWSRARKVVRRFLGRRRAAEAPDVYTCLEAITVDEVVDAAVRRLGRAGDWSRAPAGDAAAWAREVPLADARC
jgi:ADP-heptose:LPS heptosyltransferase